MLSKIPLRDSHETTARVTQAEVRPQKNEAVLSESV